VAAASWLPCVATVRALDLPQHAGLIETYRQFDAHMKPEGKHWAAGCVYRIKLDQEVWLAGADAVPLYELPQGG
jgi:hypothetical protein